MVIGGIGLSLGWRVALATVGVVGALIALGIAATTASVHARGLDSDPEDAELTALQGMIAFVKRGDLLLVFAFYLVSMMAVTGLQSFTTILAVDGYGFTDSTANTLLTAHLTATAIGVVAGGPLADLGSFRWVVVGTFLLATIAVGGLVTVATPGFIAAFALLAAIGFLLGLALPSRDKFANSVVDPEAVGRSFGFFFTGLSLGAVVSPTLLGVIIDVRSARSAFVAVAGLLLTAATIVLVSARVHSKGN